MAAGEIIATLLPPKMKTAISPDYAIQSCNGDICAPLHSQTRAAN